MLNTGNANKNRCKMNNSKIMYIMLAALLAYVLLSRCMGGGKRREFYSCGGHKKVEFFTPPKDGVLRMYYADWCGHCKRAKPDFEKLPAKNAEAIDCTQPEEARRYGVRGFPTYRFFPVASSPPDSDDFEEYTGGRDLKSLRKFLGLPELPPE